MLFLSGQLLGPEADKMEADTEGTCLRGGSFCQKVHILISVCQSGSTALIKSQHLAGWCGCFFCPRNLKHRSEFLSCYEHNDLNGAL